MVEAQVSGLAAVLEEPGSGGYAVKSMINPRLGEIRAAFEEGLLDSKAGDVLFLYFAGHGLVSDSSQLFLAGVDAYPEYPKKTAYGAEELGGLLDSSAASTVLVVLDCCHAGRMTNPISSLTAAVGSDALASGDPYRRRALITSSTDLEFSHYDENGSIFTAAVTAGLKGGADLNHDGVVDIEELHVFVSSLLREFALPQSPAFAVKGGGGAPAVVRLPGMRVGELVVPSLFVQAAGGASAALRLLGLQDEEAAEVKPNPDLRRRLDELDKVIDAAAQVWDETVIVTWLRSNNGHLGGARPIDAFAVHGPEPVLAALNAEAEGVFA
jgi:molecular chaperone DnaK